MMFPIPVEALLFDLDGTLADTVPDLADAADATLAELGRPPLGEDRVRLLVGKGIPDLVWRMLAAATPPIPVERDSPKHREAVDIFRRHYRQTNGRKSRLYPDVRETLTRLCTLGLPLACITNKSMEFTRPLLELLGVAADFKLIVAGDTLPEKKPHPAPLLHACRCLRVAPDRTPMVGDSPNDIAAARAARCPVFCVPYGYAGGAVDPGDAAHEMRSDAELATLADLLPLIRVEPS